jgi:hypothetical protein
MWKRIRNEADSRSGCGTDIGIKCGTERLGDKMRHFNEYLCVFDLCFFAMECNVVVLFIHNISCTTFSIKVVTETIVKCALWALKV